MAKKKSDDSGAADDGFFEFLAEETGGDVLDLMDSITYFVDTGSLAINYICSGKFIIGGVPGGKITEIYGPSSSSKSLLGANILYGAQRAGGVAVLLDCENAANKEFIKSASHCNLKRIVRHTPRTLEQSFSKMYRVIEKAREKIPIHIPIVIVYDSISVSPSERELREVKLPENYTVAQFKQIVGGKEQPGERAKICSAELRKLNVMIEKHNATVVILNQTRTKIGAYAPMGAPPPQTTAGGGTSLIYYASCRLETKTQKKIEKNLTAKVKKIFGVNIKMKNMKNRTHRPFVESENIQLLFDRGINPLSGLLTCLLEADRIEVSGKGSFIVKEPWAGGEEIKFKASLDRNDFPLEILLKCPSLIDASSKEQIEEYLKPFDSAINFNIEDHENLSVSDIVGDDAEDEIDEQLEG